MSDPSGRTGGSAPDDVRHPFLAPGASIPGLSSWVLERRLGGGGFGEVWLARHAWNENERPRAVKFCTDPHARHRLVTHEKNVVLRVMKYAGNHPNIVPLLDCNLDGQLPWLMYEFVEGGTLAGLIEQWREFPLPKRLGRAVRTLHAIAGALATCHRFDPPLVHRDMKPQNVLMADGKVPRITDFGIGSVVLRSNEETAADSAAFAARLPTAMHTAGTRIYAPPEQMFGSPPNPRDDVYALGVIAYQMLVGDLKAVPGADAALELRDLKVPGELAALVVRSVALNADRRPVDAGEWESTLAALIRQARKQSGSTESTASRPALLTEPSASGSLGRSTAPAPLVPDDRSDPTGPVRGDRGRVRFAVIAVVVTVLGLALAALVYLT
jgi:serine/threonine protein kinase